MKKIKPSELPFEVRSAWEKVISVWLPHGHTMSIVYYREDALFVRIHGICDPYKVVQFVKAYPDIHLEISGRSDGFVLRLFWSDWIKENELPRAKAIMNSSPYKTEDLEHELKELITVDIGAY